jgi:hypothetical protein
MRYYIKEEFLEGKPCPAPADLFASSLLATLTLEEREAIAWGGRQYPIIKLQLSMDAIPNGVGASSNGEGELPPDAGESEAPATKKAKGRKGRAKRPEANGATDGEVFDVWKDNGAKSNDIDPIIASMNEEWCVIIDGGRTRCLHFIKRKLGNQTRLVAEFLSFEDFKNFYLNQTIIFKGKPLSIGKWWLGEEHRRTYTGLVFDPGGLGVVNGKLNLWRGWGVEPAEGDWSLMHDHIMQVIANGNEEHGNYILDFLAYAVRHPDQRAEVALVLIGGKGTGKELSETLCAKYLVSTRCTFLHPVILPAALMRTFAIAVCCLLTKHIGLEIRAYKARSSG